MLLVLYAAITGINGAMKCNGMEELCDLRIDQITFPGSHNAGSDSEVGGPCLWRNQDYIMIQQFMLGIRFFDIDTCWDDNTVKNCHCSPCHHGTTMYYTLSTLNLITYYESILPSLFQNTVLILHFNGDAAKDDEPAKKKIGETLAAMLTMLWDPEGGGPLTMSTYYNENGEWPTLRQAINSKQRIFIFMENGPAKYIEPAPKWLHESNDIIRSSWKDGVYVGPSGCEGIIPGAEERCDSNAQLMELAAFGASGLCIWDMARKCDDDDAVGAAIDVCYSKRQKYKKTVNFLTMDYAVDSGVVSRAHAINLKNIQSA